MYSNKYENGCQCMCYTNWYARYVKCLEFNLFIDDLDLLM